MNRVIDRLPGSMRFFFSSKDARVLNLLGHLFDYLIFSLSRWNTSAMRCLTYVNGEKCTAKC